jgi:hypothetical protein
MKQSFPSFAEEHSDFISILANETVKLLTQSYEVRLTTRAKIGYSSFLQHAWVNLSSKGAFAQFIPLANAFDRIEAEAEARKERSGEVPLDLVSYAHLDVTDVR